MLYNIFKALLILILRWGFKLEIKGKDAFPKKGTFILASNHLSNLDPIVVGTASPRRICFLAKKELFKHKLSALLMRTLGVTPLPRGKSGIKVMRQALEILKKHPLLIFPQGTRMASYDTFKAGVGFLYKRSRRPVIAVRIYGTDRILTKGSSKIRRGKIRVHFARVSHLRNDDTPDEIAAKVMAKIKSL